MNTTEMIINGWTKKRGSRTEKKEGKQLVNRREKNKKRDEKQIREIMKEK